MNLTQTIKRTWLARLGLTFSHSDYGTQLSRTQRTGPLSIQKAFYPEGRDCAHVYLLHPPAGIVSGDELHVDLNLPEQAHVLVTTPGANRFYRARHDVEIGNPEQKQITHIDLAPNAKCEHFPLETIVYDGAQGINQVIVKLKSDSVYLGWDISCLGLPSSEQPFEQGKFSQLNQVICDNKLLYHDRIVISPENNLQNHMAGLASNTVFATFLAYAPSHLVDQSQQVELIDKLREVIEQQGFTQQVSVTHIKELLIVRYLGQHAEQCKQIFILLWQEIRPLYVKKQGIVPRIWHT
ncbi:urease accessory protein UreD [Paraglaciecola sp.]|uniref:urease accessory protein UreD n=1 Tax=Paraglaciecola sp. TaxID=1920173 RepID=UPI003EF89652